MAKRYIVIEFDIGQDGGFREHMGVIQALADASIEATVSCRSSVLPQVKYEDTGYQQLGWYRRIEAPKNVAYEIVRVKGSL